MSRTIAGCFRFTLIRPDLALFEVAQEDAILSPRQQARQVGLRTYACGERHSRRT
jgi:hypothetical protein